jgi:hypothetical protein
MMSIRVGQFWLLKTGPVVEITKEPDCFVHYELNGMPAKVLKKHFLEMSARQWAAPKRRKVKREKWPSGL